MASPQKENGYTSIANEIIEAIINSGLNGTETAVVLFVLRKTYGWNKKEDEISLSQFTDAIPVTKKAICTALNNLQLVKIITLVKKGNSKKCSNLWLFNKDYEKWQLVKKSKLVKKTSSQLVYKTTHTKDTIQKKEEEEEEYSSSTRFIAETLGVEPTKGMQDYVEVAYKKYKLWDETSRCREWCTEKKIKPTTLRWMSWIRRTAEKGQLPLRDD